MPSDQETTPNSSPSQPTVPFPQQINPNQASDVFSGFAQAEDPFAFISAIKAKEITQAAPVAPVVEQTTVVQNRLQPASTSDVTTSELDKVLEPIPSEPEHPEESVEDVPADDSGTSAEEGTISEETPDNSLKANVKAARKLLNEKTAELKATKELADKLQKDLEKINSGEAIPDVIREKDARIAELEPLEKIVKGKASREYQDRIGKPMSNLQTRLDTIAASYSIPKEVLRQVLDFKEEQVAEVNRFLENSVSLDINGVLDVKQVLQEAHKLAKEAQGFELDPDKTMQRFIQEAELERTNQEKLESASIAQTARKGYRDCVQADRTDDLFPELSYRDNDEDHNLKWAEPIDKKAQVEYGKMIKLLRDNGLKRLPDELAFSLARAARYTAAAPIIADTRRQALQYATKIEVNTKREGAYSRPAVGSGTPSSSTGPSQPKVYTPGLAAEELSQKIFGE